MSSTNLSLNPAEDPTSPAAEVPVADPVEPVDPPATTDSGNGEEPPPKPK